MAAAPAEQQQPEGSRPLQWHDDRLDAHAAEVNVPANRGEKGSGKEREGGGQPGGVEPAQFAGRAPDRDHPEHAEDGGGGAHGGRAGLAAEKLKQAEGEGVGIGVDRADAEVTGEKDGAIGRIGQDAPRLESLERFVEVEARRDRADLPETQQRGNDQYCQQPDPTLAQHHPSILAQAAPRLSADRGTISESGQAALARDNSPPAFGTASPVGIALPLSE